MATILAANDLSVPLPATRWVVYATFDPENRSAPHAIEQIVAYREAGFDVLVVDASPAPHGARSAAWERLASAWRLRANIGYDFGSYAAGCSGCKLAGPTFDEPASC